MNVVQISGEALSGGQSLKIPTSTASAPVGGTAAAVLGPNQVKGSPIKYLITCDVLTFGRKGTGTVTAVSDGTDQVFVPNTPYVVELMEGEKLAFIVPTGTGNVYLTPGI